MDEVMERAVRTAPRAVADAELRLDDDWEYTCRRIASVAIEAAAPALAGELVAYVADLLERAEWAESEVVRLREERSAVRRGVDEPRHPGDPDLNADVEAKPRPAGEWAERWASGS